ncbi:hypothetical protein PLICRDRAFT_40145 [Plicaturopsis crispa FD-325 SS-3]|nr:hypothetical protein PLICRDRAFT_40145 [Plicaturopsis crispa FD-325 SS-3]
MEQDLDRVVQAILIASDPTQGTLHQQALEYVGSVQQNAETTWRLALALFVDANPDGTRKYPPQARFFALRVLDDFFDNRFEPLDEESFRTLQQSLMTYIQSEYVFGPAEANAPFIRNKFSHTMTLFFLCTYVEQWSTFFVDLFTLIRPATSTSSQTQPAFNRHVSLLFFHLVTEISGEVADQIIKSARQYNSTRHARDARVRDMVRDRDAARINEAVLTIVADGAERMAALRKTDAERDLEDVIEVVDWGVRTFGNYVGWIDINLTVTPTTIPLLFSLLSDPSLPIRLATSLALLRIVSKGLKEPADKLQLIKVLSLGQVVDALESKTRAQQTERGKDTDEGEESYREALGKLLNVLGLELAKLSDDCPDEAVRSEATVMLNQILPVMLRFMGDEYDDTCSTVFPLLSSVLTSYKRIRKTSSDPIDGTKRTFLTSLLGVILEKMKWDEDADPEDMDEDDRAAFDTLRKDLRSFMDSVLMVDQDLATEAVRTLALSRLSAYQNGVQLKWNDAELAVYLVYIFGEINKSGGKGRAAFCHAPPVDKEKRKATDYSDYPLTNHGEMLAALVQSGISGYPRREVTMQFFETAARYGDFFKVRRECIMPTLQAMIDPRGLHNASSAVRSRVFYLFHRFVKDCRNEMSVDLAVNLVDGIRDLLVIEVELPELDNPEQQDMITEAVANPGIFDAQLYLFETAGILTSLLYKTPTEMATLLLSTIKPLMDGLEENLQAAKGPQNILAVIKVHHIIMAIGNVAKGFPDYPSPPPKDYILPPLDVFGQASQAILVCLEAMNIFKVVRDATRFAFSRIIATTGPFVTHFVPTLMKNLLTQFEPSELADFLNFLGLLIHKLQRDFFEVLDELIGPLSAHIRTVMSQPITGTDDQLAHAEIKKAYLALLNGIMASKVNHIFISERNKAGLEPLLENMQGLAENVSDPSGQRAAFQFFGRCVTVWGLTESAVSQKVDDDAPAGISVPGFERFIYERLVPSAFGVLSSPALNLKDGQVLAILNEIANFLQIVCKTRGDEAYNFFLAVFLPSQNWPPETALEFTTKLRDLDTKSFRKYFIDFVRTSRAS